MISHPAQFYAYTDSEQINGKAKNLSASGSELIDIILERTMGKPEESLRIVTAQENVEAAEERIAEIIRQVKMERGD